MGRYGGAASAQERPVRHRRHRRPWSRWPPAGPPCSKPMRDHDMPSIANRSKSSSGAMCNSCLAARLRRVGSAAVGMRWSPASGRPAARWRSRYQARARRRPCASCACGREAVGWTCVRRYPLRSPMSDSAQGPNLSKRRTSEIGHVAAQPMSDPRGLRKMRHRGRPPLPARGRQLAVKTGSDTFPALWKMMHAGPAASWVCGRRGRQAMLRFRAFGTCR